MNNLKNESSIYQDGDTVEIIDIDSGLEIGEQYTLEGNDFDTSPSRQMRVVDSWGQDYYVIYSWINKVVN